MEKISAHWDGMTCGCLMWRQPVVETGKTLALILLAYGDNTHAAKSASDMCERVCVSLYGVRLGPSRQLNFNYVLYSFYSTFIPRPIIKGILEVEVHFHYQKNIYDQLVNSASSSPGLVFVSYLLSVNFSAACPGSSLMQSFLNSCTRILTLYQNGCLFI